MKWVGAREAIVVAYVVAAYATFGALSGFSAHEVHLFLADHLLWYPFQLIDPRWYSGFNTASHPPLVHALVAALAHLPFTDIERAYAMVVLFTALLFTFSSARLSLAILQQFAPQKSSKTFFVTSLFMSSLSPLTYIFLYDLGQLPFMFGVSLLALGLSEIVFSFEAPSFLREAGGALLLGCSAAAHPSLLPLSVSSLVTVALMALRQKRPFEFVGAFLIGLAILVIGLLPFLKVASVGGFSALHGSSLFETHTLVAYIAVASTAGIAITTVLTIHTWPMRFLAMVASLGAVLSTTGGVPYFAEDKLLLLSWCLVTPLAAQLSVKVHNVVLYAFAAFLWLGVITTVGASAHTRTPVEKTSLEQIAEAFRIGNASAYRYLTIGVGSARLKLSRHAPALNLDGGAFWAKTHPLLRKLKLASFDDLDLSNEQHVAALRGVLKERNENHVRWVVSTAPESAEILQADGYVLRGAFRGELSLYENSTVVPISGARPPAFTAEGVMWAVVPVAVLALACALIAAGQMRRSNAVTIGHQM